MNLYHNYPHVYWQCACLTVNASANEDSDDNKSTNYGKIASAIGAMQSQGVNIALPEINSAGFGFLPDAKNNRIIFGLKGMTGIGDDLVRQILANRPYDNIIDFCNKVSPTTAQMITLIKGGCFDALENIPRPLIMRKYLSHLASIKIEAKDSLNFQNFASMQSLPNFIPAEYSFASRMISFRSYIFKPSALVSSKPKAYLLDRTAQMFFENELLHYFTEDVDYYYEDDRLIVIFSKYEKVHKSIIKDLADWVASPDTAKAYTKAKRDAYIEELWNKDCTGSVSAWEMDALSFYYSGHELKEVRPWEYGICNFFELSEEPEVQDTVTKMDKKTGQETTWKRYKLSRIMGTVLDANKTRHTVSLLTPDGVVNVKFYAGAFVHYNKQISTVNPDKSKTIVERSWFQRGTKLLITGIRRGDSFMPKTYFDSVYRHTVCRIESIDDAGNITLKTEREDTEV